MCFAKSVPLFDRLNFEISGPLSRPQRSLKRRRTPILEARLSRHCGNDFNHVRFCNLLRSIRPGQVADDLYGFDGPLRCWGILGLVGPQRRWPESNKMEVRLLFQGIPS